MDILININTLWTQFEAHKEDLLKLWQTKQTKQWQTGAQLCMDRLLKGDAFQTVLQEWDTPWRPRKVACANLDMFRAYFIGKLLHRANDRCTYLEFPGGSLIRQPNTSSNVLLFDLLHGALHDDAYSEKFRLRWWGSVTQRFRRCAQEAFSGIFPLVEDGEIEHGGCEHTRYNRRWLPPEGQNSIFTKGLGCCIPRACSHLPITYHIRSYHIRSYHIRSYDYLIYIITATLHYSKFAHSVR